MIPRPKNTDTMEDVLKMQNDYLKHKNEENFQPAAQTISKPPEPKQSVFAKRRNLKQSDGDKKQKTSIAIGEVVERKHVGGSMEVENKDEAFDADQGFPKPAQIDTSSFENKQGQSIFSQMIQQQKKATDDEMETDEAASGSEVRNVSVSDENLTILSGMSQEEILEERAQLLKKMDPKLVEFLRSKRKSTEPQPKPVSPQRVPVVATEDLPVLDFLNDEHANQWLNFDILEPEKLEWTRNIEKTFSKLKPGDTYEARFDWKGFLLPYIEDDEASANVKDNRELYFHGESPERPGYTLQELLRIARASVLQQRVAAINAIAGIINIYNQGYYDGILELPISKLFFFLRLAMDENTPVIMEVSSRALAFLFHNDTDEALLDIAYETKTGLVQPKMDNRKASIVGSSQDENEADLESSLKNLTLGEGRKMFDTTFEDIADDEELEKETVNDFHLAEVNLVECLMRSNILERISYILTITQPMDITVHSCLKILIRLARTSRDFALRILNKHRLVEAMTKQFLEDRAEPHAIVIKLFRILCSYDRSFCTKLQTYNVVDIIKRFMANRRDLTISFLKLQIESFRFLRLYFRLTHDESSFAELISPIRYLLEWHFESVDFQAENHFIIRQHASALLQLLDCGNRVVTFPIFAESFIRCCCKWFAMATRGGAKEFSQKLLLSTALDVSFTFVSFASGFFFEFVDKYLLMFMRSPYFQRMVKELKETSPMFSKGVDRCNVHKPLVNLGSVVRRHKKSAPTLVLSQEYSIYLMESLLRFINAFDNMNNLKNHDYHVLLCAEFFSEDVEKYLEAFAHPINRYLHTNWFLKTEINFVFSLLTSRSLQFNAFLLKIAFNLLNCLTQENLGKILHILKNFVFSDKHYFENNIKAEQWERWRFIYNGMVVSSLNDGFDKTNNFAIAENWNQILLTESWPYSILLVLLHRAEVDESRRKIVETELTEEEIITTSLKFTNLLENQKIQLVSTNQQLMYLMLVYFGKDLNFLDDAIKQLVRVKLRAMKHFQFPPRFNTRLNKEKSFESLYTMFLDTFQSNSYGDDVFSILVMIPLAQKYDVKWRKLVWSEYVTTMTFISCRDADLLDPFSDYLNPPETDASLLKCYAAALSSNILRPNSIPWRIAQHHVAHAKRTSQI